MPQADPGHGPPAFEAPDDYARLRDVLARAQFADHTIVEALGVKDVRAVSDRDVPLLLHATRRGTPLDTLVRLFLIGVGTDVEATRRAIEPMTLEEWVAAGLVRVQGSSVVARVRLLPFQGFLLAYDRTRRDEEGMSPDHVMGIGSSSLTLANLTIRRPCELALDLGTGCGIQAFLAARHSARVVAADRNPRAVGMAAFNARLNGLANVECLEGDAFEPVQGRVFGLVVSNPPFVISPDARYLYRDSGLPTDQITQKIVREVPPLLREGGYCQILCNWAHIAGQDWRERLAGWFAGTGCDAWAMRSETFEAGSYACNWLRHTERDDPKLFLQFFEAWMAYYERERIEAISGGLITLRRRSGGRNWFRADDAPDKMLGPAGDAVLQSFELHDFLEAAQADEGLLRRRLRVSPDVRWEQRLEPTPEGWSLAESELRLTRGLTYSGRVDPFVARLVARCDGERELGALLEEMAIALGKDAASVAPACLDIVRRLVERGFLLPAGAHCRQWAPQP